MRQPPMEIGLQKDAYSHVDLAKNFSSLSLSDLVCSQARSPGSPPTGPPGSTISRLLHFLILERRTDSGWARKIVSFCWRPLALFFGSSCTLFRKPISELLHGSMLLKTSYTGLWFCMWEMALSLIYILYNKSSHLSNQSPHFFTSHILNGKQRSSQNLSQPFSTYMKMFYSYRERNYTRIFIEEHRPHVFLSSHSLPWG